MRDFMLALRRGVSPGNDHYFPVFPYGSFTKMTDQDILDLKAYIFRRRPSQANREHEIDFLRLALVWFWKQLNFTEGPVAGPGAQPRVEPRRLPGRGPRPLRRVPRRAAGSAASKPRSP
jgi:hypothetical protein